MLKSKYAKSNKGTSSKKEKEDIGLLKLMEGASEKTVCREEIMIPLDS